MHYYVPSFAPLTSLKSQLYRNITVSELLLQCTKQENIMFDCNSHPTTLAFIFEKTHAHATQKNDFVPGLSRMVTTVYRAFR